MDKNTVKNLLAAPKEERYIILENFSKQLNTSITYNISKEDFKELWTVVIGLLLDDSLKKSHTAALCALKILSRKKEYLNENVTEHIVSRVLLLGGFKSESSSDKKSGTSVDYDVIRAAQKCTSNMIFNSEKIQTWCCTNALIPGIVHRLKKFKTAEIPNDVIWFDLRLMFLLSGKCANVRQQIRTDHRCDDCLIEILSSIITKSQCESGGSKGTKPPFAVNTELTGICNEALKTLYNLFHSMDHKHLSKHEESGLRKLMNALRYYLLSALASDADTEELHSNVINLLLLLPSAYFEALIPLVSSKDSRSDSDMQYCGKNVEAIAKIINFLQQRLSKPSKCNMECLSPVLTLMIEMSMNNRVIRKYIRLCILPPLTDVSKRPEEGDEIRNKLCGLMTSPIPQLKQSSADLIFILCKESVDRLVKYTGYGNAAGLLASRGLMLGGRGNAGNYSSDSEQSDTEEYERVKDQINPVTGRLEPPRSSPFEGMSEEQKEYETMKLVNALDKLNRQNIIQPCIIDEDGKPRPINDVNELRNNNNCKDES